MEVDGASSSSQKLINRASIAASQMRSAKAHDWTGNPATANGNRVAFALTADIVVRHRWSGEQRRSCPCHATLPRLGPGQAGQSVAKPGKSRPMMLRLL